MDDSICHGMWVNVAFLSMRPCLSVCISDIRVHIHTYTYSHTHRMKLYPPWTASSLLEFVMCVCVYVYVCIYPTYVHTYIHIRTHTHIGWSYTRFGMPRVYWNWWYASSSCCISNGKLLSSVYTHIFTHTYVNIYIRKCVHTYSCGNYVVYLCVYIYIYSMYVCMYKYVY